VNDAVGPGEEGGLATAELRRQRGQPVKHADRRIFRGRRHLGEGRRAVFVDRDEVGEGAPTSMPMR